MSDICVSSNMPMTGSIPINIKVKDALKNMNGIIGNSPADSDTYISYVRTNRIPSQRSKDNYRKLQKKHEPSPLGQSEPPFS